MMKNLVPKRANCGRPPVQGRSWQLCIWVVAASLCIGTQALLAQTPANTPSSQPVPPHKVIPHHKSSPAHAVVPTPVQELLPAPPAPEPPKWPVNDAPAPPSIRWDSRGLQVDAANSSLRRILDDVSTTTGAKVEGLGPDERVFGIYGPGPARDVLSQILHGSSYNVLMLGDQGEGTPREIILSQRSKGGPQTGQANNHSTAVQDDDVVEQPEAAEEPNQQQPVNRPPMGQPIQPGGPMTPQQRMLEMQRQQMQMQQQQQQQNQPVQPPQQPQE